MFGRSRNSDRSSIAGSPRVDTPCSVFHLLAMRVACVNCTSSYPGYARLRRADSQGKQKCTPEACVPSRTCQPSRLSKHLKIDPDRLITDASEGKFPFGEVKLCLENFLRSLSRQFLR